MNINKKANYIINLNVDSNTKINIPSKQSVDWPVDYAAENRTFQLIIIFFTCFERNCQSPRTPHLPD
jgi:hypothetical protein